MEDGFVSHAKELDHLTKRSVERFNNLSLSSSKIVYLWATALLVLWLSGLEPRFDTVSSYVEKTENYKTAVSLERTLVADTSGSGASDRRRKSERLEQEKKEVEQKAMVPFEFPGGIKIPVPVVWAPTIWIVIAFLALLFLLYYRNKLIGYSTLVAERLASSPDMEPLLKESIADAPFWLAPLTQKVGVKEQAAILGWKNDNSRRILCVVCYMALILIMIRVTYLSFSVAQVFGSQHERTLAPLVSLLFSFASCFVILEFILLKDKWCAKSSSAEDFFVKRRALLFCISAIAISLSFVLKFTSVNSFSLKPRFKEKKRETRSGILAINTRGLHLNVRTNVMHYILDSGQILGVTAVNVGYLKKVETSVLKEPPALPRININRASATFELIALDYIKQKKFSLACDALMLGILYNREKLSRTKGHIDFRLYDLLAGISVRYELHSYIKSAIEGANEKTHDKLCSKCNKALVDRAIKWNRINGQWRKKWEDSSKEIIWCALPMQDSRFADDERSTRSRTTPLRVSI